MLSIHLGQDENDCFSAWVSAKEAGLTDNKGQDQKGIFFFFFILKNIVCHCIKIILLQSFIVNYGSLLLQALLEHWWRPMNADDDNEGNSNDGNGSTHDSGRNLYFSVPGHTPVIFRYVRLLNTLHFPLKN